MFSVVMVGGRVLLNTLRPHETVPTAECQSATPETPDLSEPLLEYPTPKLILVFMDFFVFFKALTCNMN